MMYRIITRTHRRARRLYSIHRFNARHTAHVGGCSCHAVIRLTTSKGSIPEKRDGPTDGRTTGFQQRSEVGCSNYSWSCPCTVVNLQQRLPSYVSCSIVIAHCPFTSVAGCSYDALAQGLIPAPLILSGRKQLRHIIDY